MATSTYERWERSTLLGVMRDVKREDWMFAPYFTRTVLATDEYIDFEKLPVMGRKVAPYVLPKGRGLGVYGDRQVAYRFKPANVVVEESVDDSKGLTFEAGIDPSMLHEEMDINDPMVRRELLKAQMTAEAVRAVERRWEQQRAEVIRTGKLSITYLSGESYLLDFQRASGHTEVLTSGNRFGDSGVSVLDTIERIANTMNNAEFGGIPVRIVMGGGVWSVIRKDAELRQAMKDYAEFGVRSPGFAQVNINTGPMVGAPNGGKVMMVGTVGVGGPGGQAIELWVNNETYDVAGSQVRYVPTNQMVFLGAADAIMGHMCFGRILDLDAEFQALPIFAKNFVTGERVKTEQLSFESAPLAVPINPNATYQLTPIA